MRTPLPHTYWNRLFAGILATALSLGCGFSIAMPAASALPQAGEDSGTDAPQPPLPKPLQ